MMFRYLPALLLAFSAATFGEDVPCLMSRENCTHAVFYSSLSIVNNTYRCCVLGYTMDWNNDRCVCKETNQVTQCQQGPEACSNATSLDAEVHTSDRDNIQCCPEGFRKNVQYGYSNGSPIAKCMCWNESAVVMTALSADGSSLNYTYYVGDPFILDTGFLHGLLVWRDWVLSVVNESLKDVGQVIYDLSSYFKTSD